MAAIVPKIVPYLWPHRYRFLSALFQVVVISGFELLKPWPLKVVIDNVLGGQALAWAPIGDWSPPALLLAACLAQLAISLSLGGLNLLNHYTTIGIGHAMVNQLRGDLYHHLQRLSLSFHNRRQTGDLLYRVTSDTYAIQTLTMNGLFPVLCSLTLLGGMFVIMLHLDLILTIVALLVCPILILLVTLSPLRGWLTASATQMLQQKSSVLSLVQWAIPAVRVVQAFTKEQEEHQRFMSASESSLRADLRFYLLQNLYSAVVSFVIAVGTVAVIWWGARHVLGGTLTLGELIVFIAYLTSLYGAIDSITQTYGSIQAARVGAQRVFEIMEVEDDLKDGARSFPAHAARGAVAWNGISFQHLPGQPILKDIHLQVSPGQTVAIVGPTGAGKSTLLSLLPRFYDPQSGSVTIDGIDVREFQLKELRRQITMVLQPPLLLPLTIHENITYGRPASSMEDVVRAARLAQIHDFITQLPRGYDTVVSEQGVNLSEGERQRLTIARAILLDAPILILDEPTSSIDADTEARIMEGLRHLTVGRTSFIIAHRLSTVRQADLIVVLRDGRVAEQGTFEALLRRQGEFARLYRRQLGGPPDRQRAAT